jgi:hypothetical protein
LGEVKELFLSREALKDAIGKYVDTVYQLLDKYGLDWKGCGLLEEQACFSNINGLVWVCGDCSKVFYLYAL